VLQDERLAHRFDDVISHQQQKQRGGEQHCRDALPGAHLGHDAEHTLERRRARSAIGAGRIERSVNSGLRHEHHAVTVRCIEPAKTERRLPGGFVGSYRRAH
jgi:hypothetical protein